MTIIKLAIWPLLAHITLTRHVTSRHPEAGRRFPMASQALTGWVPSMKLTKDTVAELKLEDGKADQIWFDDDLPGFGVRLRAGGKAVWIIQYRIGVQQRRETLGDIRKVDLKAAREEAKKRFAKVTLGSDPAAEREEAAIKAKRRLGAIVEQYLTFKADRLKPTSLRETARYLRKSWRPLHGMPIHKIERADVAAVLNRIAAANG